MHCHRNPTLVSWTILLAQPVNATPRQKAEIGIAISEHSASSQALSKIIESKIANSDVLQIARSSNPNYLLTSSRIVVDKLVSRDVLIYDLVLSYNGRNNVHLVGVCYRNN